ncbi:MAG TPA: sugar phosphate isomerase/epimerase family protein [Lentisphaeria bacterium]|nr:sugar phosphate isomerase/epimerase family protein [Lentisphaeria bacterium]
MIKTGVMLMSNRGPDGQPWDWREALKRWKSLGLAGVDVFHGMLKANNETPTSIKRILDDLGLEPTVYCVPTNLVSPDPADRATSLDTIRAGIDACGVLGVKHLFSHGGQHNNEGEDAFLRYMDGLNEAAELVREAGLLFSIENAGKMCNSGASLARTLDLVKQPNMRITFDGGNFITCGDEPHDAIMTLRAKVAHVHVKSHVPAPAGSPRPYLYCPTGVGHPDYRFIRDRLIEVGYSGWMSFEPEGGFDSKWDQSIKTLAEIIAEIK